MLLIFSVWHPIKTPMNKAPRQRSHGLRFEPGTAANWTVFKAQDHTARTQFSTVLILIAVFRASTVVEFLLFYHCALILLPCLFYLCTFDTFSLIYACDSHYDENKRWLLLLLLLLSWSLLLYKQYIGVLLQCTTLQNTLIKTKTL